MTSRWRDLIFVPPLLAVAYLFYDASLKTLERSRVQAKIAAARAAIPQHGLGIDRPYADVPLPSEAKSPCYTNTSNGITLDPR